MLYFKALFVGLSAMPQADPGVARRIDADAAVRGWPALHADLATLDPVTAARLAPNDSQRIQRALEVIRLTGQPIRRPACRAQRGRGLAALQPGAARPRLAAPPAGAALQADAGSGLRDRGAPPARARRPEPATALDALRRLPPDLGSVGGQAPRRQDDDRIAVEVYERGLAATRQLAKRQITWLRSAARNGASCPATANSRWRSCWRTPSLLV